ncbi:Reticulon-like protein [Quillaja saponaria]|uniref:Reticulon-like protein n=1 Tax=Quillaja saponaria TaxID=32244 RepID=A0AAD7P5J7_QUISA|nr:Reticulon-like protein [Quillaja saponaria]
MSRYSHGLHDQYAPQPRLFGRQRPIHAILGGGKFADLLLWKDKKLSAAILIGFTIIWFLFEVVEYHFVTLLCHILIGIMLILFIWYNAAGLITWSPPNIHDIQLPESTCRYFFSKLNWFLFNFYQVSCGQNFTIFFLTIVALWIISVIGTYISTMNLLYFVFLCLEILPVMYERYEYEVEYLASKDNEGMKNSIQDLNCAYLNLHKTGF